MKLLTPEEVATRSAEDHAIGAVYVERRDRKVPWFRERWAMRRDLIKWVAQRRAERAAKGGRT